MAIITTLYKVKWTITWEGDWYAKSIIAAQDKARELLGPVILEATPVTTITAKRIPAKPETWHLTIKAADVHESKAKSQGEAIDEVMNWLVKLQIEWVNNVELEVSSYQVVEETTTTRETKTKDNIETTTTTIESTKRKIEKVL